MSKYIIKNCPAYKTFYADTTDGGSETVCTKGYKIVYCQDCTDCVLKRIVELCKNELQVQNDWWCGAKPLAEEILQLFEIEECK